MTPMKHLSVIEATGTQARDFLHAQLSADVAALESGEAVWGCFCNPQGRVLDLLLVTERNGAFLLLAAGDRCDELITRLRMFVMRSDVGLVLREDLLVYGLEDEIDGFETIARPPGGLIYGIGTEAGTGSVKSTDAPEKWRAREFEAGILWLNPQTSGEFLPQWLGFDQTGAINFRKGCYPGQEIIARMHYLGKVKRLPLLCWLDGPINAAPKDVVQLHSGDSEAAAVIAGITGTDEGSLCYLVVRNREALQPTGLSWNGQTLKIQRWATI